MSESQKLKVLEELLEGFEISEFSRRLLEDSKTDEDSIRKAYRLLKQYGLSDPKIASQAQLLGMNPDTIEWNSQRLSELG